jgi:hypothetical protein
MYTALVYTVIPHGSTAVPFDNSTLLAYPALYQHLASACMLVNMETPAANNTAWHAYTRMHLHTRKGQQVVSPESNLNFGNLKGVLLEATQPVDMFWLWVTSQQLKPMHLMCT